jgi:cytochrome c oxidase subunit 3
MASRAVPRPQADAPSHAGIDVRAASWARTASGFGMVLFLASDLMLFAAFFAAYFVLRGSAVEWPPDDVELDVVRAVAATTALVASSFTLMVADRAMERDERRRAMRWVLVTIALGTAFLSNQVLEYTTIDFGVDSHPYGSVFWLLTGLHGAHVTAGIGALAMLFVRVARGRDRHAVAPFATSVSAYWHLVDVVWIGVFSTVWLLR